MKEIPLTQGKVALVDDGDYPELSKFKWCAHRWGNNFYVVRTSSRRTGKRKIIHMHAVIAGTPTGSQTDHINGDGLDNRRENLRIVSSRGNNQNRHTSKSSKYPGVCWHKLCQKWQAQIWAGEKKRYLGLYDNEEQAYAAYCGACAALGLIPVDQLPSGNNRNGG